MSVQNQLVWGISRKYKRTLVLVHQKGQKRLFSFLKDEICQCRHLWHLLQSLLHIVQSLPEPWRGVHLQISGDEQLYRKSIGGLKSTDTDPCSCWNMMKCGFSATCYPIVILQLWGAAGVKQTKGLKLSFTVRCVCVSGTKTSLQGWCDTGSWDGMRRTTTVPCRLNLQIPQIPTQHLLIIGQ